METLRLFVRMYVDALTIFNELPLKSPRVVDVNDPGGDRKEFRKLRRTEASRSCHDLEAFRVRANGDGLDESIGANAL